MILTVRLFKGRLANKAMEPIWPSIGILRGDEGQELPQADFVNEELKLLFRQGQRRPPMWSTELRNRHRKTIREGRRLTMSWTWESGMPHVRVRTGVG